MTNAEFCFKYIQPMTEEVIKSVLLDQQFGEFQAQWRAEVEVLGYARRWLVEDQSLPSSVKRKIIDWVRLNEDPSYKKTFEVLAAALEKDDRSMILGKKKEEIEI
jgi:hypothetical protein